MASYKVAQDVEADDKLLGPFGFRQFIYLIIVSMSMILGYGLWQLFPPLAILPLPLIVFFGALALPLRKDQPMETYLAAMVSYYIKPRRRLWKPDGIESVVEITAPKTAEESLVKAVGGNEADRRLDYLANIADTRGWSIRNAGMPAASGTSMIGDVYNEAQVAEDVLDESTGVAQKFEGMIDKADADRRQRAVNQLQQPQPVAPDRTQYQVPSRPQQAPVPAQPVIDSSSVHFDPYPSAMHQSVIQPISQAPTQPINPPGSAVTATPLQVPAASPQAIQPSTVTPPTPLPVPEPDQSTSVTEVSPDIMNLANNSKNLSVETIAHEAKRLHDKESGEVLISLR